MIKVYIDDRKEPNTDGYWSYYLVTSERKNLYKEFAKFDILLVDNPKNANVLIFFDEIKMLNEEISNNKIIIYMNTSDIVNNNIIEKKDFRTDYYISLESIKKDNVLIWKSFINKKCKYHGDKIRFGWNSISYGMSFCCEVNPNYLNKEKIIDFICSVDSVDDNYFKKRGKYYFDKRNDLLRCISNFNGKYSSLICNEKFDALDYSKYCSQSKVTICPLGFGYICGRDFTASAYNSVILKNYENVELYPNIFSNAVFYKNDLSNIKEKLEYAIENYIEISNKNKEISNKVFKLSKSLEFNVQIISSSIHRDYKHFNNNHNIPKHLCCTI